MAPTAPVLRQQRGFALLIVLWSLALLALLATGLTATGRSDAQLAANIRRAAGAQAAADGGVAAAVFHVADPTAAAWPVDGQPHSLPIGRYAVTVTVRDESRKVNPNYAPPELMRRLLVDCGADPARADAVTNAMVEWHEPGQRGPFIALYRSAGLPAAPPGAAFSDVEDLGLVMGMTPALLDCLRPHLSVYAKGPPDVAQADPIVRAALIQLGTGLQLTASLRPSVLDITADARARDGSRAVRHAVVALGQNHGGPPFSVVRWDAAAEP